MSDVAQLIELLIWAVFFFGWTLGVIRVWLFGRIKKYWSE